MGMFLNYHNIADNYTPNNLVKAFPVGKSYTKLDPVKASKPYEEYNSKGELIGYSWYYGETLNLEFNIDGEIVVESDALIYTAHNDAPSPSTEGHVGRRAYNIADMLSWTCTQYIPEDDLYVWEQDDDFEHDLDGATTNVYVSAKDYLSNKKLELKLLNFRFEPVFTQQFNGTNRLIFNINKELSDKLVKGVYYCSLTVINDIICTPIFGAKDCTLLVK